MGNDQGTKFIGLDVHKNSTSLTIADEGTNGGAKLY